MVAYTLLTNVGVMAFALSMISPEINNTEKMIFAIGSLAFTGVMEILALAKEDKLNSKIAELEKKLGAKEE